METPLEIRYAGVVVARASEARRMTVGGVDLFLAMPEPLPAGTLVSLGAQGQARIEKVIESADPSVAGVYVRLVSDEEAARPWVPSFREAEVPAPRPPAVVVSPVIVRPAQVPRPVAASAEPAPRPAPIHVEPPRPAPVPPATEAPATPLPEVAAAVVQNPPPAPFTTPMPQPGEQVAHFDPPAPPPAVIEHAVSDDRRRPTIVVTVAPPADPPRPPAAVEAVGEIDTGSRKAKKQAPQERASIVVEVEEAPDAAATPTPVAEEARPITVSLEELPPARPLPPARGRTTKSRRKQR